jgi:AraC-like DNA-binding protein
MNISPSNILFILIIFQLFFLSLFLLTHEKGKRVSNILLGSFFLSICLNLLDFFFLQIGYYSSNVELAGWGTCIPLLFGPLIYLYTKSIVYKDFSFRLKTSLHFLPFLLLFAGTEYYYLSRSQIARENIISEIRSHHFPILISITSTLIFIQFLTYAIVALRLVRIYKKASGQYFSNSKNIDVSWLYTTIVFFITIIIISTLNGLFAQTNWVKYYLSVFNFVILSMLFYVIRILLKALWKPGFFSISGEEVLKGESAGYLNKKSHLKTGNSEAARILLQYVENKKPYLNPDLTLDLLAAQLSIRPRVLSTVINEELGHNFYDFINRYRIEEASRLLTNPKDQKITVLEVLYEVGFNSKSSFNTLFKKYTGLTPSEFKKKNLNRA